MFLGHQQAVGLLSPTPLYRSTQPMLSIGLGHMRPGQTTRPRKPEIQPRSDRRRLSLRVLARSRGEDQGGLRELGTSSSPTARARHSPPKPLTLGRTAGVGRGLGRKDDRRARSQCAVKAQSSLTMPMSVAATSPYPPSLLHNSSAPVAISQKGPPRDQGLHIPGLPHNFRTVSPRKACPLIGRHVLQCVSVTRVTVVMFEDCPALAFTRKPAHADGTTPQFPN